MKKEQAVHEIAGYIHQRKTSRPLAVAVDGIDAVGIKTLTDSIRKELWSPGLPIIRESIDGFYNLARLQCCAEIHSHHI